MTKKKVTCVQFIKELKSVDKDQAVYDDVMKIEGHKSLISVCTPLQLILCTRVKDESEHVLGMALQGQLQSLRERVCAKGSIRGHA
jgi:hypothetical protein